MPKRVPSPEGIEVETYFAVYNSFPLDANWKREEDCIACCHWIVTCMGIDHQHQLHALFHKPSIHMIVLAISKNFVDHRKLLGRHDWSKFLKNVPERDKNNFSQIYYSTCSTLRSVEKAGWRRVDVESTWFDNWDPSKQFILDRPPSTWCDVPSEDKTNKPLCRPIPLDLFPEVARKPTVQFVVGSEEWINARESSSGISPQAVKTAWRKQGSPRALPPPVPERSAWNKPIMQNSKPSTSLSKGAPSPSPTVASPANPTPARSVPNTWGKPLQLAGISPPGLSGSLPPKPVSAHPVPNAWRTPPSLSGTSPSPGLTGPSSANSVSTRPTPTAWRNNSLNLAGSPPPGFGPREIVAPSTPPGLTRSECSSSTSDNSGQATKALSDDSFEGAFEDKCVIYLPPEKVVAMSNIYDEGESSDDEIIHPWENYRIENSFTDRPETPPAEDVNLWTSATPRDWNRGVAQCPYHDYECKKGVCKWRWTQWKEDERRKKEMEKKEREREKKQKRLREKKEKRAQDNAQAASTADKNPSSVRAEHGPTRSWTGSEYTTSEDGFSTATRGRNRGRKGSQASCDDDRVSTVSGSGSYSSGPGRSASERSRGTH